MAGSKGAALMLICAALFYTPQAQASVSASLSGVVRGADGEGVQGAEVVIVHEPSGTSAQALTVAGGQFFQSGLRVGGPFTLQFKAAGFRELRVTDVWLRPGPQAPMPVVLEPDAIEEIVVTAAAYAVPDLNNGAGSAYSAEDIAQQPGASRDVIRTLLRDPLAQSDGEGHLAVAGANPRFNGLVIDGSLQQDDFGLGSNTYATRRSPINLDAVESASLVASDYSVSASGFTGGLVRITTRSGGNEWDGAAFLYRRDDGLVGDRYKGGEFAPAPFTETERGLSFGGPIIHDRLFVFVSYDEFESASPADFSAFDNANGIRSGLFDRLAEVIETVYGYDPLGRPDSNTPSASERSLVKLDWNLSPAQRLSLTWQSADETDTSVRADSFESAWYERPIDLDAWSLQVYSDWTPRLATSLRANRKTYGLGQNCRAGSSVGALEFDLRPEQLTGTALEGLLTETVTLNAGCDRFRHANEYNDERLQLYADADYVFGAHIIKAGIELERFDLYNLFLPSSRGRFVFDGYDAILTRTARVDYVNVPSNRAQDAASSWGYERRSVFVQDAWLVTANLELTAGLRYERFAQDDAPAYSAPVFSAYGARSDANLDGAGVWMPRLGWHYSGLERTVISGGFGVFAGGDPKVWISNAFQPPTVFARLGAAEGVTPLEVPAALLEQVAGGSALPADGIAEDFRIPSVFKASLRVERSFNLPVLGRDFTATAQYLHARARESFLWRNLAHLRLAAAQPFGQAPDGRVIYADLDDLGALNFVSLSNHEGGRSHVFSAGIAKVFASGVDFSASYARQDIETVAEGISSRGISNWRNLVTADRNNPSPRRSPHQTTHSWKLNLGYERGFGAVSARLDIFGRLFSGDLLTYTFDVDRNNALFGRAGAGESPFDADPLYIPAQNDPAVVYASTFDRSGFENYVRGAPPGIHSPFLEKSGWNQVWDLRFRVNFDLPGRFGRFAAGNRVSFVLDIENVANLLNSGWGRFRTGPFAGQAAIVQADLVRAADVNALGVEGAAALTGDAPRGACQSASDCVYRFNGFDPEPKASANPGRSVYRIRLGLRLEF